MKLAERYKTWSDEGKNLFILICVALFGILVTIPFIFLDNVGILLGWLLGSAINIIAYITIIKGSRALLRQSGKAAGYAIFGFSFRFLLYAAGLLLAAFCTFRWGSMAHGYCNIVSLALAYMPTWVTLVIVMLVRKEPKPDRQEAIAKKEAELNKLQEELAKLKGEEEEK